MIAQLPNIEVLSTEPADWDQAKVVQLWESYVDTYPNISAAFFHNDDMALAARHLLRAARHRWLRTRSFCVWNDVTDAC